jgi:hypothetical protein
VTCAHPTNKLCVTAHRLNGEHVRTEWKDEGKIMKRRMATCYSNMREGMCMNSMSLYTVAMAVGSVGGVIGWSK